jgi:chemotaxis protein CheZ
MTKISTQVLDGIRENIVASIEREVTNSLSRLLIEGEFYKRINSGMQDGLRDIYREIASAVRQPGEAAAQADGQTVRKSETADLITEASSQLNQIFKTTETATIQIMDVVERHLDLQAEASDLLAGLGQGGGSPDGLARLRDINDQLGQDLIGIMTSLSFQDLTGQRIKRIVEALQKVERIVFDLYVSTGLQIKAREAAPDKDLSEVEAEARQRVEKLKGPQSEICQNDVDGLLAQLGL